MGERDNVRSLATRWSLLADDTLLSALEKLHQKVLSSCESSRQRLDALSDTVRGAEQHLAIVNDRFASLSNRQFVERRVYEDDTDIQTDTQQTNTHTQNNMNSPSVASSLSLSLQVLRQCHDIQQLVGSDDSDDDITEVLRMRDMYSARPLPHVIGTDKWRAGCFPTESQSESDVESTDEEDYNDRHTHITQNSLSIDSGSLKEEPYSTQQDLVEEIQSHPKLEEKLPYMPAPQIYNPRPLIPRPDGNVFQTEPPPEPEVAAEDDEEETQEQDSDSDSERKPIGGVSMFGTTRPSHIAAILNRNRNTQDSTSGDESLPSDNTNKQTDIHDDKQDIFDDLFAKSEKLHHKTTKQDIKEKNINNTKQSIHNTKEDIKVDTNNDNIDIQKKKETKGNIDIFNVDFDDIDNIFTTTNTSKMTSNVTPKAVTGLFDDDNDMFKDIAVNKTGEVTKKIQATARSIFDSDDDELFGTVSKSIDTKKDKIPKDNIKTKELPKTETVKSKFDQISKGVRSIFDDSDDELFSADITTKTETASKSKLKINVNKVDNKFKDTKGLFSDSDDELFASIESKTYSNKNDNEKPTLLQSGKVANSGNIDKIEVLNAKIPDVMASPNLFDDDEELLFNESRHLKEKPPKLDLRVEVTTPNVNEKDSKVTYDEMPDDIDSNKSALDVAKTTLPTPDTIESSQPDDDRLYEEIFKKGNPESDDVIKDEHNKEDHEIIGKVAPEESLDDSFDTNNELIKPIDESYNINTKICDIDESNNIIANKPDLIKQDVFTDIFNDVPPEFEKPKEPKRSKNVNALFDDDSDDESLFFKKNDNFDELPPETETKDNLFGLFLDEPPNIDVDFMKKDTNVVEDKQKKVGNIEDIIKDKTHLTDSNKTNSKEKVTEQKMKIENIFEDDIDDIFKDTKVTAKSDSAATPTPSKDVTDKPNTQIDVTEARTPDKPEPKKIEKLKPMNIKIDVNTLKPGASLLKKNIEQTDGQSHAKSNEELHTTQVSDNDKIESTLVKSVSFEGNVDTNVLDNKLSKERAKIQVKRRPSTRKARREAARVSGIQFPSPECDVTDGTTQNDEIHKNEGDIINTNNKYGDKNIDISKDDKNIEEIKDLESVAISTNSVTMFDEMLKSDVPKPEVNIDSNEKDTSEKCNTETNVVESKPDDTIKIDKTFEENKTNTKAEENVSDEKAKDVKSKVVYILNDEDIFNTKSDETKVEEKVAVEEKPGNKVLSIIDDDDDESDDLFKYMATAGTAKVTIEEKIDKELTKNIKTEEKQSFLNSDSEDDLFKSNKPRNISSKEIKTESNRKDKEIKKDDKIKQKSLFGDSSDSDEELFKPKTKKIINKPTLFDSDSESELFGKGLKDNTEKKETVAKEGKRGMTASLFGDDDDDDLFTTKS